MRLLPRFAQETDRNYALRMLKENIINLDLIPGSQISENEIAAQMGLSRTPVREALIELSRVKIVKIVPQKKSTVSLIDYELVEEACFMRRALECEVVELACQLITPPELYELDQNVKLQNFYLAEGNFDKIMELDNQFHEFFFVVARKTQIYELIQNMQIHFDRVRRIGLESVKDLQIIHEHERILEAVQSGDTEHAVKLTRAHLSKYKSDIKEIYEKHPQYFES